MFIEQSIRPENRFWKYLVGSVVVIAASFIGQVPLVLAIFAESYSSGRPFPTSNEQVMSFLHPNLTLFLLLLSFALGLAALFLINRALHSQSVRDITTGRPKIDWGRIWFAFGLWAAISIISTVVAYFLFPEDFVVTFDLVPFLVLAVIGIIMIPLQTSAEEFIFRGYLMQGFANLARNKWFPLLMTSVIFGTMHILNPEVDKLGYIIMVYYIGTGLFLGIISLMDDGIELALGFHAANNLIGALLVTADWTAFKTPSVLKDISEPTAGYDIIFPVLIIYPILLFIFSKKYKWTGWQEKLTGNVQEIKADGQSYI